MNPETFAQVQRMRIPRGRRAKSDRLLARLGVLRCGTCGARMIIGTSGDGKKYSSYRCPPTRDCKRRVAISADIAEEVVVSHVRRALADDQGRASVEDNAQAVEAALVAAQADLDAAIRAFAGLEDEQAARDRLSELRDARDAAQEQVDQLGLHRARVVVTGAVDWDLLSLAERRALIRATIDRATVAVGGQGADRIAVELVGE